MALIECSKCGKLISDKAISCPNCGELNNIVDDKVEVAFCEDCGEELPNNSTFCPNCGCPVTTEISKTDKQSPQKVEISAVNLPVVKKSAKKYILISVSVVIVIAILVTIGLIVKNNKAQKSKEDYIKNVKSASYLMLTGAAEAEEAGNLIKSVWYNTIYEKHDTKTDKYTTKNGYTFYDDFNDSLLVLYSDSVFGSKITNIEYNQESVSKLMKQLQNPPAEFEEAYRTLQDYYNAYLTLTDLVINPSGSLQTFSTSFNDADSETSRCFKAMKMYIE